MRRFTMQELLGSAQQQGFRVERAAGSGIKYKVTPPEPGSPVIYVDGSATDQRELQIAMKRLRRAGWHVEEQRADTTTQERPTGEETMATFSQRQVFEEARAQGFVFEDLGGAEARGNATTKFKVTPPDRQQQPVVLLMRQGDEESVRRAITELRRRGLAWPPQQRKDAPVAPVSKPGGATLADVMPKQVTPTQNGTNGVATHPASKSAAAEAAPDTFLDEEPDTLDALFKALTDAKLIADLAREDLRDADAALKLAQEKRNSAMSVVDEADKKLKALKARFDAAFSAK